MKISQAEMHAWLLTPILNGIKEILNKMSALDDAITAVNTEVTNLTATVAQLGTDLTAEIARLQASGVSAAQLASLTAIASNLTALGASVGGLDTQAKGA